MESSFEHLIAPVSPEEFLRTHWESSPLHVARNDPGHYSDLFSSARLEQVLHQSPLRPTDLRVVRQQVEMATARYTLPDGGLNLNQLYKAYGDGHTLVINSLQRFDTRLARLVQGLQSLLSFQVEVNVYLTPPATQGLHPHFDTHDVFVLQVEGRKTWHLYGLGQVCPLLNVFQPVIPVENLPPPEQVVELSAGDLLYLPRGHVHDAVATTEHSMHLTLGIYPIQWVDLLQSALTQRALRDVRYRRAVPVGILNRRDRDAAVQEHLRELLEDFSRHAPLDCVLEAHEEQHVRKARPPADDHFSSIHAAARLTLESCVQRRPGMRCRVTEESGDLRVQFPGNTFRTSADYRKTLLQILQSDGALKVRDFAGPIDDGRRVLLAQRLVQAGLLRVVRNSDDAK